METQHQQLHARIMRRVWYSFAISTVRYAPLWYGIGFGVSLGLFRELVFVSRVIENFLAVPVGNAPSYALSVVMNALQSGEFLTLASLGVMGLVTVSLVRRLAHATSAPVLHRWQVG